MTDINLGTCIYQNVAVCLVYDTAVASYVIVILIMFPAQIRLYKAKAKDANDLVIILTLALVLCALQLQNRCSRG